MLNDFFSWKEHKKIKVYVVDLWEYFVLSIKALVIRKDY